MPATAPLAFFLILSGAAVGSFMAAWADRLPRGESVVREPSRCRRCGTRISWRDKMPILSWLMLGGKCRTCETAIPKRLFYAEIAGAALAIAAVWGAQSPLHMVLGALFLWILLGLVMCDLAAFRLPNVLTGLLAVTGFGLALEDPFRGPLDAVIGGLVGAGVFWVIRVFYQQLRGREGLGLGDVKLMGGIGVGLGATALPVVALIAAITAMLVAICVGWRKGERPGSNEEIPFGAYLAGAAGLWFLIG
ncbi:Type 4 prepilin-like proteins leader peptide-processing enzyme [Roseovarius gaetbuli]|uniref:Prepilin leader peptidase/N-methyltransferase n=1 Tax=Roseovarius gaetbuli TaxID=1356575 RepID=A0A1X6ZC86_9RHOB|nr:A24 family peptidase [Roseovarius gaetbuli]SLN46915.1 Type 4 prepilin-like proteins leader peptide-processing enzyme [Roseovarius gaetbuli]